MTIYFPEEEEEEEEEEVDVEGGEDVGLEALMESETKQQEKVGFLSGQPRRPSCVDLNCL